MLKIRWRRVFLITIILTLAITYLALWIRMLNDPVQNTGTDFVPFYAASQISKNEGPSLIYDLGLQQGYEESLGNFSIQPDDVRIFLNPPFVVPLVNLISSSSFVSSLVGWELLNLLILMVGTYLAFDLLREHHSGKLLILFLLGIISFFPGYKSLVIGQNSAILFLGAIMLLTGTIKKKNWLAGLGLAIMTIRPHIVLPLVIPFILKRRKIWWWFVAGSIFLALVSLWYVGWDGIKGFIDMVLISGSGTNSTTGEDSMVNIIGILLRSFPSIPTHIIRWIGWGFYFIGILFLCIYWKKSEKIGGKHISLAILITTVTVPHIHMHDLILWTVPLILFFYFAKNKEISFWAASMPWWISMALLCCFINPVLEATIPYLILSYLFLLLMKPECIKTTWKNQYGEPT